MTLRHTSTRTRKRKEGDDTLSKHSKRAHRSTELPEVAAAALQLQHQTWTEYARVELRALQTREPAAVAQMLLRLDRHGCQLRIVRSRCPSLVSLAGVVLVETRHTLVLQADDGAKRRVPKAGSTFALTLPAVDGAQPLTVHLRGEQLIRATSR